MNFKRNYPLILALGIALATPLSLAHAQSASNDVYQALVKREFGTAVEEMKTIEKQIQDAKPGEFPAIEKRLVAVIDAPDATMPGKQFACQMLRLVGSRKCVPSVAKLLTNEQLSHMARTALVGIRDSSVDDALLDAMKKTQGNVRVGIVNTMGDRGDTDALKPLAALLKDGDEATLAAALNAIGKIGGGKAADILDAAKVPDASKTAWAQACLRCASGFTAKGETRKAQKIYRSLFDGNNPSQVRAAAFRQIVLAQKEQSAHLILQMLASPDKPIRQAALSALIDMPGHAATVAFTKELGGGSPVVNAMLIGALAARGDAEGLTDWINMFATNVNQTVRESAIMALGRLGNASSVPVLVAALKDATNGPMASIALVDLRGDGVADSLIKQTGTGDDAVRASVLGVLAQRKQIEALPVARKLVNDGAANIREAAVKVLSELGTQDDLQCLCDAILATKDGGERDRLARAITAIGVRLADKANRDDSVLQAFAKADAATKVSLLATLSAFGGDKPLDAIRSALAAQGEVRKAAVRGLAEWQDAAPLADLRKVAKEESDQVVRILALRGCIKMIPNARLKTEEKVQAFREVMELSTRPDEKRQALSEIGKVGHVETLKLVEPCLGDENLKREALQAYEKIAESLTGSKPDVAKDALQKVLAMSKDESLRDKARAALEKVK